MRIANMTANIAAQTGMLRNYLITNKDVDEEKIMMELNLSRASLYSFLYGLRKDNAICVNKEFYIKQNNARLKLKDVEKVLAKKANTTRIPKPSERLLYLYHRLHSAIPYGGISMDGLRDSYSQLIELSGGKPAAKNTLTRMIQRDLEEMERIGIAIDRPATGSKKYCLKQSYLPKLSRESAAAVYVSMLLFSNTLLEQATTGARIELAKAFFRPSPKVVNTLQDRIYVLGDTLAKPQEFGDCLTKLITSVVKSYRIKITYKKVTGEVSERLLEPLGMICKRNVWYVVARIPDSEDFRTFRVDQILAIYPRTDERFTYPEKFSISDHIGSSWGVFDNDPVQKVKLKFSPRVARRVENLVYHRTQNIEEKCPDGSIIVNYDVCGLIELTSWILQWGNEVEVLEPESLRQRVLKHALSVV
ncbi:MAG: WYL domain-containing protein, partial [Syntrophomonadaceae bacterium]|nr:WYL domain-containing protein [Syntrophomonadaceae bacterium]